MDRILNNNAISRLYNNAEFGNANDVYSVVCDDKKTECKIVKNHDTIVYTKSNHENLDGEELLYETLKVNSSLKGTLSVCSDIAGGWIFKEDETGYYYNDLGFGDSSCVDSIGFIFDGNYFKTIDGDICYDFVNDKVYVCVDKLHEIDFDLNVAKQVRELSVLFENKFNEYRKNINAKFRKILEIEGFYMPDSCDIRDDINLYDYVYNVLLDPRKAIEIVENIKEYYRRYTAFLSLYRNSIVGSVDDFNGIIINNLNKCPKKVRVQ